MLSSSPQLLGENSVSLEQAIDYLQTAGKLPTFLFKVFQHSTMPALKLNHDRNFQPAAIEQVLLDFCIEHELIDPANFIAWLNCNQSKVSATNEAFIPRSLRSRYPILQAVADFIEAHYHQAITLSDVAQAAGYSPAYLTDFVRQKTGKAVNYWIIERRMIEARRLLRETNQPVNQIAEALGYQHPGHFFRQFRQHHETTPQTWRKQQKL